MAKKTKDMLEKAHIRFQLRFRPEYEPDVCEFLLNTKPNDRHAVFVQALRILMKQTGYYDQKLFEARMGMKTAPQPSTEPDDDQKPEEDDKLTKKDLQDMKDLGDNF